MSGLKAIIKNNKGQMLPVVLLVSAILSVMAFALLQLFQYETKFMVKHGCIIEKEELAAVGLEHTLYKLQQGSNWYAIPKNFLNFSNEFTTYLGNYTLHVVKGNLFMTGGTDRQGVDDYRTITIKVKTKGDSPCTGSYYAVVLKKKFGGPLVSKGKIDMPVNNDAFSRWTSDPQLNFYWGNIYSANPDKDACHIPLIEVGRGTNRPQNWMPQVYAKGPIYTTMTDDPSFGYTYDNLSPTAHAHPLSEDAKAPDFDLEYYKKMAKEQGSYYGPANIPGLGANPNYINDGNHDIADVTNANRIEIMANLLSIDSVLFIDTTDGLPLRESPCNSYSGSLDVNTVKASDTGAGNNLIFWEDKDNQYFTQGVCIIQGPLVLMGDDPSDIDNGHGYSWEYQNGKAGGSEADRIYGVWAPNNYYYPQDDDGNHYNHHNTDIDKSYLDNVKHNGILYSGGELRIGGQVKTKVWFLWIGNTTDVCIYGTIYLGELGKLTVEGGGGLLSYDDPKLHVYYNENMNVFGFIGRTVSVMSFNELSFLMPTPVPNYPTSF